MTSKSASKDKSVFKKTTFFDKLKRYIFLGAEEKTKGNNKISMQTKQERGREKRERLSNV
jgi:hypothetical protein